MTRHLPMLLLLMFAYNITLAQQNLLMLQKRNRHKNAYYKTGDVISFRIHGGRAKIISEIIYLNDSIIGFEGFSLRVDKISHLYIDDKTKWWLRFKLAQVSLLGGAGYVLLDVINTGELSNETAILGGAIIAVGVIAKILIGNKIKIRGRTRLRIVNLRSN